MNSSFQSVTMMQTSNIRHTVVVTGFYLIVLFLHSFFYVNMDVFECCARVSCIKTLSKNTALKINEAHSHLLACFSIPPPRLYQHKSTFCDIFTVLHRAVNYVRLDRSFIFTVITGILSKCLIITFGNISIQNRDSSI